MITILMYLIMITTIDYEYRFRVSHVWWKYEVSVMVIDCVSALSPTVAFAHHGLFMSSSNQALFIYFFSTTTMLEHE